MLSPFTDSPGLTCAAALFVQPGPIGAHVGVVYADDSGELRVLHQAWHKDTRNETLADCTSGYSSELSWVRPGLNEDEQNDLRAMAVLAAKRLPEGGLPYAFARRDARVLPNGSIALRTSAGLTCATLVLLLFEAANVPLLSEDTWDQPSPERSAADCAAQETAVAWLNRKDARQASVARADIGNPRIRPEEVAAASSLDDRPVDFQTAKVLGASLLAELQAFVNRASVAST